MVKLTKAPIRVQDYINTKAPSCGAVAVFIGQVRNRNLSRKVKAIHYTAYKKMAKKQMTKIVREATEKSRVKKIIMVHRTGLLKVGEISLIVVVFSPHRKEAFAALRFCVEQLKERVPVFKKEVFKNA